jgi:hypothetical protein
MTIRRLSPSFFMLLAACQSTTSGIDPESVTQPPQSTFRCTGGATLKVESLGSSVNVTQDNGNLIALPALPAGSRSRYSEGQAALVFNGREALFMVTGKPPLECRR